MKSLLPQKFHFYIYIFALLLLAIGLPLSKYLMSLSQLILLGNWILEGNLKNKFILFWKNKPAFVLSSLLFLHFLGLIYTSDFGYALNDIRIKLPLFALPLIISTSKPFSRKMFDIILQVFVFATLIATIVSSLILADIIHREITDIRDVSIFISHIRFGLLICVGIFICGYFAYTYRNTVQKLIWSILIIWFVFFLVLIESMTGLAALFFTAFILIIYVIVKSKSILMKLGTLAGIVAFVVFSFFYIKAIANENKLKDTVDFSKLEKYTPKGNLYENDFNQKQMENGHYVWIYFCMKELEPVWNRRSKIKFGEMDLIGDDVRYTLIRFLASKGLRKDEGGINTLTDDEIRAIERGVTNVNYQNVSSLKGRIYETFWELKLYEDTGDPNGHSLTQRFEYWKAALGVIKQNLLFGVGSGDMELALNAQYEKMNSHLLKDLRFHAHNQYLSIAVAFGLIGLLWFFITLFYPVIKLNMTFNYLYITFFIIALISFLNEDTLETQAGVTFYAFFNTFFLFAGKKE